jgi:hypothetical protein
MAKIANVALTNTFETWRVRSNEAFDRLSQFAIDNSKLYANTLTANVRFVSSGATRLGTTGSNRTIVNGLLSGNGNLIVSGNTTVGGVGKFTDVIGLLTVNGRASITTNLQISGNTIAGGTFSSYGATTLGLSSTNLTTITGRASVGTNLSVAGNTSITRHLTVTGNTNVGKLVAGNVATYSLSTIGPLTAEGRASISTNLEVYGNTTLGGSSKRLTVGGSGAIANVTGWFGVTGRATVSTNLFVGGNTTINGTTTDRSNALSQTLTDGATINWDTSLGRVATVTLGGNRAIAAPTNLKVGTYILYIVQDATGSRTITWNSVFKWTAGVAPPLTTTANARDIFSFVSDGTNLYGSFIPDVR